MDVKLKLKIREAGASRDLDYFSAGWQDLFQIAERLSVVDALYKNEQPILILDDPFVNLDVERLRQCSLHVYRDGKLIPFCAAYLSPLAL